MWSTSMALDRPCKVATFWPARSFVHRVTCQLIEYEAFITQPLQDHNGEHGITIHPVTDTRAQPWNELIKANLHEKNITQLPPKTASVKEVKEYLYLVVTKANVKGMKLDLDHKPFLANTMLSQWKGNGKDLRKLSYRQWCGLCPAKWYDVAGGSHNNSQDDRELVGRHLWSIIHPLASAERREQWKGSETDSEIEIEKKKLNKRNISKLSKLKMWLLCARKDVEDVFSDSDTLPDYKEKEALDY